MKNLYCLGISIKLLIYFLEVIHRSRGQGHVKLIIEIIILI